MANPVEVVEGWTGRLDWQLLVCSTSLSISASDRVSAWYHDRTEAVVTTSTGVITEVTATCGHVGFTVCTSCHFRAALSPYTLRFHVKDAVGKVVFFPSADPIVIMVRSA